MLIDLDDFLSLRPREIEQTEVRLLMDRFDKVILSEFASVLQSHYELSLCQDLVFFACDTFDALISIDTQFFRDVEGNGKLRGLGGPPIVGYNNL